MRRIVYRFALFSRAVVSCVYTLWLTIVMQYFLDQVDVSKDHTSTTISLESKCCKSFSFIHTIFEIFEVLVPLVSDDFAATEASNLRVSEAFGSTYWNDHTSAGKSTE